MKAAPNRLRVLRAERRMSQMDTAEQAGLSMSRYWRIENGYVEPTSPERAALASALTVDEREIFPQLDAA
jgi:transcriptional regulator with XRE-family HTH domain